MAHLAQPYLRWLPLFVLLVSCSGDGPDLEGRAFVSESVQGRELVPETEVRLSFESSKLNVAAGCNGMSFEYSFDGDVLVVGVMTTTAMACGPARDDQDAWIHGFLKARPTAEFAEPRLTLKTPDVTMKLVER